ncbi:hypothetical protein CR513_42106, partial [Mucuna pruriens]
MARRLMSSLVKEEVKTQRETIFHYRCLVLGILCSFIIDNMNSVHVASLSDRNPINNDKDLLHDTEGPMTRSKIKMRKQFSQGPSLGIKESLKQSESEAAPKYVAIRVTLLITLVLP